MSMCVCVYHRFEDISGTDGSFSYNPCYSFSNSFGSQCINVAVSHIDIFKLVIPSMSALLRILADPEIKAKQLRIYTYMWVIMKHCDFLNIL